MDLDEVETTEKKTKKKDKKKRTAAEVEADIGDCLPVPFTAAACIIISNYGGLTSCAYSVQSNCAVSEGNVLICQVFLAHASERCVQAYSYAALLGFSTQVLHDV